MNGKLHLSWIEALNLRHAKEKILLSGTDVTDIRDWTNERKEDLEVYLSRNRIFTENQIGLEKSEG